MLCSPKSHGCNGSGSCANPCVRSQRHELHDRIAPADRRAPAADVLLSLENKIERQTSDSATPIFRRVLLATDFSRASQAAFATAIRVCEQLGAKLTILHVFEYADTNSSEYGVGGPYLQQLRHEASCSLDRTLKAAQAANIIAEAMMKAGAPGLSILNAIEVHGIDLVILGTNALHGIERMVFGSTAEEVLRSASCSVLTVGPRSKYSSGGNSEQGPVVFATDFHYTTTGAIRYAQAFCKASKAPLHCLHVLPRNCEMNPENGIVPQIMTEALQQLASEGGKQMPKPIASISYGSEISNAIVDYASKQKASLIVLGVRRSSMIAAHLPAHIAYRIITEAPCPVLTMAFASRERPSTRPAEFSVAPRYASSSI
jgi:nucleotide-binding universal stress UspA family protein